MRAILVLVLILVATVARAAAGPCPYMTLGWGQSYSGGAITSVSWSSDYLALFVVFNFTQVSAFTGVSYSVPQAFMGAKTPAQVAQVYTLQVLPRYHAMLLAEQTNCPILNEVGRPQIWTD
jgi:hypothetical protein